MDREIRFRAWDCFNETMWMQNGLGNFFTSMEKFTSGGNKIVLMQYTGLHDKNGKEIYFKDIVEAPSGQSFIVDWLDDEMRIALRSISNCTWYNFNVGLYKVIGNIYENPELLNNG